MSMVFETSILSLPGDREENEDAAAWRACEGGGLWALADGLGGHGGGARASRIAVDELLRGDPAVLDASEVQGRLQRAQDAVLAGQQQVEFRKMHTTAVVLVAGGARAVWGHVGDSRLYLFRGGLVAEQTRDHSYLMTKVEAGDLQMADLRFHEDRSQLLASLGSAGPLRSTVRPEPLELAAGDAFLLASDGWWELILETEMEIELAKAESADAWLRGMHQRLLERAGAGHDNYSAIGVLVHGGGERTT
jgi:serine/threonine protein phosphatase PrpC